MCHSGVNFPKVAIVGPTTVVSGSTNSYTLTNSGVPNSGLDVAVTAGTLTAGSATKLNSPTDLTHSAALTTSPLSWTFSWTAPAVTANTTVTMYGASITGGYPGATGSTTLTITVTPPAPVVVAPSITTQPASLTVTAGQAASFSVAASGTAPLSYQWKKGTTNVGTNSSTFSIASAAAADAGSYTVVVTNSAGSATSNAAILTVNPAAVAPAITTQPGSLTVTAGQTASFSVAASGTAPLSYQWKKGTANVGTNSSTFSIASAAAADAGSYTVVVTNSAGSATSNAAILTVNAGTPPPPPPTGTGSLAVSPSRLVFYAEGGDRPAPKTIAVSSTGSALQFTAAYFGGTWLSVTPSGGTTPSKLTVSVYPAGLAAGTYSGVVKITSGTSTVSVPVVLVVARDDGEERESSRAFPFTFDPGDANTATAGWLPNQGLVLSKSSTAPKTAIAGAAVTGAAGSQLTELGYDLLGGSQCTATAPQLVVVTADDVVHTGGCTAGTAKTLASGWKRVRFNPADAAQLTPAIQPGMTLKTLALVMDQTSDKGIAVLNNIDLNGKLIAGQ